MTTTAIIKSPSSIHEILDSYIDRIEKYDQFKVMSYNPNDINDQARIYSFINDSTMYASIPDFYNRITTLHRSHYNNTSEVQEDLDIRFGPNNFIVLEHKKLSSKHKDRITVKHCCGHIHDYSIYSLFDKNKKDRNTCECCKQNGAVSSGEVDVETYLKSRGLSYFRQYRFKDCKDVSPLPFDFLVYEPSTKNIISLIEFDGAQHFKETIFSRSEEQQYKIWHHDLIKDNYCKQNNLKLIRIPYYEQKNIAKILDKHLMSA